MNVLLFRFNEILSSIPSGSDGFTERRIFSKLIGKLVSESSLH